MPEIRRFASLLKVCHTSNLTPREQAGERFHPKRIARCPSRPGRIAVSRTGTGLGSGETASRCWRDVTLPSWCCLRLQVSQPSCRLHQRLRHRLGRHRERAFNLRRSRRSWYVARVCKPWLVSKLAGDISTPTLAAEHSKVPAKKDPRKRARVGRRAQCHARRTSCRPERLLA